MVINFIRNQFAVLGDFFRLVRESFSDGWHILPPAEVLAPNSSRTLLTLKILAQGDRRGREVNEMLRSRGVRLSAPAFYQHIARMADDGLVQCWDEPQTIGEETIPQRFVGITDEGRRRLEELRTS